VGKTNKKKRRIFDDDFNQYASRDENSKKDRYDKRSERREEKYRLKNYYKDE
jgi:hypothetical protein